jgi:hypothetical protein
VIAVSRQIIGKVDHLLKGKRPPTEAGLFLLLGIAGSRLLLLLLRGQLMPFEFSGPPLKIFRHVHEMKAAWIIPREFLCQPQARFGPVSEIPCIHGASPHPLACQKT